MPSCLRACLLAIVLTGCQATHVQRPLTVDHGGNDVGEQLEFWHALAERPVTSYDEAFHGLLLFLDGDDPATDYAGRVSTLRSRGMLPAGFNRPADQALDRGTLAVAIVKAMKIKGGLMLHIFPGSPRYAVRELQYMELYPPSSPNQTFSGTEFLGIIGKLEDYQRGGTVAGATGQAPGAPVPQEPRPEIPPRLERPQCPQGRAPQGADSGRPV